MGKQFLLTTTALVASIALATSAQAGGRTQEQNNNQQLQELNARVDALEAELQMWSRLYSQCATDWPIWSRSSARWRERIGTSLALVERLRAESSDAAPA